MPRALEPGIRIPIVLDSDKDKPQETQPRFFYRALNGREYKRLAGMSDAIERSQGGPEAIDAIYDCAREGLVGWENMTDPATGEAIPFDPKDLDLIVNPYEAQELIEKVMQSGRLTPDDKKKSDSSPSSSTAS